MGTGKENGAPGKKSAVNVQLAVGKVYFSPVSWARWQQGYGVEQQRGEAVERIVGVV